MYRTNETKPGIVTTEFWLTLFTNAIALINLFGWWNYVPNRWAVILIAIVNAAYGASRGLAKTGIAYDPSLVETTRTRRT